MPRTKIYEGLSMWLYHFIHEFFKFKTLNCHVLHTHFAVSSSHIFLNIGNTEMSNMETHMGYLHVTECQHLSCRWLFLIFVLKYFQAEHEPSIERIFDWPNAYLHRYNWLSDICVIANCVYNIVQAWSRSRFVTMSHLYYPQWHLHSNIPSSMM